MSINNGGVVKGGLVAGLIINISETILNVPVAGPQLEAALKARNLPPVEGTAIGIFVVMAFGLGLFLVWLYAAIRPRLGPGPRTAACAGLIVWGLAFLWNLIGDGVMGILPWGLITLILVWGLAETILAAIAGAYFYKEP